ncbi:Ada metal-binding domain-containing protein [Chloroflexota bacterium]
MTNKTVIGGCRTTKIYCRPDCPPGRRTKGENRVYFRSVEEARASGYRACKVCRPDEQPSYSNYGKNTSRT